jgi:hypothetical protein
LIGTGFSLKGTGFSLKGTGFSPYVNASGINVGLQPRRAFALKQTHQL